MTERLTEDELKAIETRLAEYDSLYPEPRRSEMTGLSREEVRLLCAAYRNCLAALNKASADSLWPHVTHKPGIYGGSAIIDGSRLPLWIVVAAMKRGESDDSLMKSWNRLTPDLIAEIRAYYAANAVEIDADITEQDEAGSDKVLYWQRKALASAAQVATLRKRASDLEYLYASTFKVGQRVRVSHLADAWRGGYGTLEQLAESQATVRSEWKPEYADTFPIMLIESAGPPLTGEQIARLNQIHGDQANRYNDGWASPGSGKYHQAFLDIDFLLDLADATYPSRFNDDDDDEPPATAAQPT